MGIPYGVTIAKPIAQKNRNIETGHELVDIIGSPPGWNYPIDPRVTF